jgi:hypothetical protein
MDWVGNRAHGVPLPYRYLSPAKWSELFARSGLDTDLIVTRLGLYPLPFGWLFDRSLHFLARLSKRQEGR